jgi:hypothetical protein
VPHFNPHDLLHRRISLLHAQGRPWARVGEWVGQRNLAVTANTYTHVLTDERELYYASLLAGGLRQPGDQALCGEANECNRGHEQTHEVCRHARAAGVAADGCHRRVLAVLACKLRWLTRPNLLHAPSVARHLVRRDVRARSVLSLVLARESDRSPARCAGHDDFDRFVHREMR